MRALEKGLEFDAIGATICPAWNSTPLSVAAGKPGAARETEMPEQAQMIGD
jgi:hypothetical protein